jgi:hypothetical protein
MNSKEVVELAVQLEQGSTVCPNLCHVDVWKEKCITCNRTLDQIKESINDRKD